ncbi:MAG: hypothetical protein DSY33_01910 [Archaeoglobus sp.]|nr:MAG: hypothetical protein DSY33_01910 [Archaeoglobus sp.]
MDADIIKTLMDDDTNTNLEIKESTKESGEEKIKGESRTSELKKSRQIKQLSEVELNVIRCLKETRNIRTISKMTGYPEIVVSKAVERLIDKGYLDYELNVVRDIPKRRTKSAPTGRLLIIDVAIAIAALIFIITLVYYLIR